MECRSINPDVKRIICPNPPSKWVTQSIEIFLNYLEFELVIFQSLSIALPLYPGLSEIEQRHVVDTLIKLETE